MKGKRVIFSKSSEVSAPLILLSIPILNQAIHEIYNFISFLKEDPGYDIWLRKNIAWTHTMERIDPKLQQEEYTQDIKVNI